MLVQKRTLKRYLLATQWFLQWLSIVGLEMASAFMELDRELANMGIVNAFDFESASSRCQQLSISLSDLQAQLSMAHGQQPGAEHIDVASRFVDVFIESVNQLSHICERLNEKAQGLKYGWFEYRRDTKEYRRLEKTRSSMGNRLNSAFGNPF